MQQVRVTEQCRLQHAASDESGRQVVATPDVQLETPMLEALPAAASDRSILLEPATPVTSLHPAPLPMAYMGLELYVHSAHAMTGIAMRMAATSRYALERRARAAWLWMALTGV